MRKDRKWKKEREVKNIRCERRKTNNDCAVAQAVSARPSFFVF
jgi:hypothetical protein